MWFLTGLFSVMVMVFTGLLKFIGLWIAYGFSWFMLLCVIIMTCRKVPERAKKVQKGKVSVDFWVCLWFGFMTAVVHSIVRALI